MNLEEQLTVDLKQAMLSKDSVAVSVLRLLRAELKNAQIAGGAELSADEAAKVIRREVKKRQDAATAYRGAGNEERALSEEGEATVLEAYLPAQAEPKAIEDYAASLVANLSETGPQKRGEVIRETMTKFGAQADGKVVAAIVSRLLP